MTEAPAETDPAWLEPTWFLNSDSVEVAQFVETALAGVTGQTEMAVKLFLAVRDGIRYDPYDVSADPNDYRASTVATAPTGWCVPKSVLLTASARRCGIPARLGYADVRNHLTTPKLSAQMGTDLFAWHGYSELLLEGRWLKLSSAFNLEMCQRFGVKVLEFDGTADALMHPFDQAGNRHMEYVLQRGHYTDLPLQEILGTFAEVYPNWAIGGSQ